VHIKHLLVFYFPPTFRFFFSPPPLVLLLDVVVVDAVVRFLPMVVVDDAGVAKIPASVVEIFDLIILASCRK
jgi:hypothetical protein